jgi:hypothetical protein
MFGQAKPLAYVLNPKAASTLALSFVFYLNHNYRYFDHFRIHDSPLALLRIHGPELDPRALDTFYRLSPESFSIVRDPLRRFVSSFLSKVFTDDDPKYLQFRDVLTSVYGIDLSPEADPAQSCLAFARLVAAHPGDLLAEPHFKPQHLNLMTGGRYRVDTVLRLEDKDAVLAFFSRWLGAEKAKWFLSLRLNEQTRYSSDEFILDELKSLMREIYARDYEWFYS